MKQTYNTICVRMPNWLGDAVMATPVLNLLRESYQKAKIITLSNVAVGSLLQNNPYIDDAILFSRGDNPRKIIEQLRSSHFDLGVLLTNSFSSAWWFYRAAIPQRLGYAKHWRSWLLTLPKKMCADDEKRHLVVTYRELLEELGICDREIAPAVYLTAAEQHHAKSVLQQAKIAVDTDIVIGINPGAAYGSAKCWPKEYFQMLTKMLLRHPRVRVVYFGDTSGKSLVDDICGQEVSVVNFAGKTNLRELMALLQQCHIVVTNDSGPMHIASALQRPLVAIFGSTNPTKTGPYNGGTVISKHVSCSPCYLRSCPIDFRCMTSISPSEVYLNVIDNLGVSGVVLDD